MKIIKNNNNNIKNLIIGLAINIAIIFMIITTMMIYKVKRIIYMVYEFQRIIVQRIL